MNYKFIIIFCLFLYSCTTNNINQLNKRNIIQSEVYSNRGFTLLFSEDLKKKKLVNKRLTLYLLFLTTFILFTFYIIIYFYRFTFLLSLMTLVQLLPIVPPSESLIS